MRSSGSRSLPVAAGRLFGHDRQVVWNVLRSTFAAWSDRTIAVLLLLTALAIARGWIGGHSGTVAVWTGVSAGALIGFGIERLLALRLTFHASDGILAADALQPWLRLRYRVAWHLIGSMLLAVATTFTTPSLLWISLPAYLAGACVAACVRRIPVPRFGGAQRPGRAIRAWLHRPVAGCAAAAILVLTLLLARGMPANGLAIVVGGETVLLAAMMTGVDDATVRFMTLSGHGAGRIVARHAGGGATFVVLAGLACGIGREPLLAVIVGAAGAAMLLLLCLRILAYRLHARRFADVLVSILCGLMLVVAYSVPVALPAVVLATVGHLQRRGRRTLWVLP